MKRLITPAVLITALLVVCPLTNNSFAQKGGEKSKGGNDQVKLYSNDVEVVEVSDKAEKCPAENGATAVRLRVKSEKPVDVRLHYTTKRGGWASSDYLNKKSGDEISSYDCHPKVKYKVQTRPAGSDKWPSI